MEPELKSHNMEIAKGLILKTFHFLEDQYSYTPVCKVSDDKTFIESFDVEYVNEIKRRKIRISYIKGKVYSEIKYTFNLSITRMPYVGNEDFFSLSNYLQSVDKDFPASVVGEFDEREAENKLILIANALKGHALDIISGEIWLNNYYPRKD
jgi:hypothetical protein